MKYVPLALAVFMVAGCANTSGRLLDSDESQVQLRSIQSRAYETADKPKTIRAVISAMQDLGFVIEKADALTGTVTGTKFKGGEAKLTAIVRPRTEKTMIVRANAQFGLKPVTDPKSYQDFFDVLSKAMFLQAQSVD